MAIPAHAEMENIEEDAGMGRIDDVATCGNILRVGIDGKCGSVSGRPKQSPMLGKSEYSGAGIGTKLADGVFALIRKNGQNVVPQCEFMARYAARHPEYNDLITG